MHVHVRAFTVLQSGSEKSLESSCIDALSTLVVVADTDGALLAKTVGPEAADVDVGLRHAGVGEEQPSTENWLGEDIQNSVGDDLLVNVHVAATVGNTPDARKIVSLVLQISREVNELTLGRQSR